MTIRNGRVSRRLGAAVLVALIGSLLAFASPSAALINDEAGTARFGGDNRYETAAAIATSPHWANETSCTPDVVIVNGENFPDGLAASVYGDRILLVKQNSIPAATQAAIIALQDLSEAVCDGEVDLEVVGGPAAVSAEVVGQLTDITNGTGGYVDFNGRHYGADRYETAIAVAEDYSEEGGPGCLVLAVGDNFPDALAAGPLVEDFECPLVLTAGDSLHPATAAYMAAEAADDLDFVYIIGGTAAIPASVETELFAMGLNTQRLGGANRSETAEAIADELGYDYSAVLVNGNSFADALAAGTFATLDAVQGPILLVNVGSIPSATAAWHVANCDSLGSDTGENLPDDGDPATDENIYGTVFAIGGTAVISDDVLAGAGAATKCGDAIDLVSVTIAVSDITEQVCAVEDRDTDGGGFGVGEGAWVAGSTAPTLIPVAGGAASGLDPIVTDVDIFGSGTAADGDPAFAVFSGSTLVVDLGEDEAGMTQARFAEIWASLPEAAATFTVVQNSGPLFGPPDADAAANDFQAGCLGTSADITLGVTFNQPVGELGDFGTTPGAALFGPPPDAATPLLGVADADGNTSFSYFHDDLSLATIGALPAVGTDFTLAANSVTNAIGQNNAEITVEITAG